MTAVDIQHLRATVMLLAVPNADLMTLESCLLVWASLVTGRHPADLLPMSVRMLARSDALADGPPGMVGHNGRWGWWLTAGAPPGQKNPTTAMTPTAPGLYLPATETVTRLVGRCVALRRRGSAGHINLSRIPLPLFSLGDELLARVPEILAARHHIGPHRARRATTTVEAIARWLPAELTGAAGGDVVTASITTGRVPDQAQTVIYYGAARHDHVVDRYRTAIASIDKLSHEIVPPEAVTSHLGDRFTPTDGAVRAAVSMLTAALDDPDRDPAERHEAMMNYTVALLCFAFAHRGDTGTMPSLRGIHRETRLCWIRDKTVSNEPTRRLVWICNAAHEQLRLYDAHLDALQARVSRPAAEMIAAERQGQDLALFDMSSGKVSAISVSDAVRQAMLPVQLAKNAGRHWLRARLVGKCSSESLHAMYGHGPVGDASWDASSALDPSIYRADVARVLDPAMSAIGWTPRGSTPAGARA